MNSVWASAAVSLAAISLLALVAWPFAGPVWALALFAGGLLLSALHTVRKLSQLVRWARSDMGTPMPPGGGVWGIAFSALNRRTKQSQALRADLSARLGRFLEASQAMPDGVAILDRQHVIGWMNAAAEDHFGLNPQKDLGAPITNLVRQPDFVSYLEGENYGDPLILRPMRSIVRTLALQVVEFGDGQKLLLSRDISQLERLERVRRDFVANVSHELKTPLTVVIGFVETLLDALPELPREEAEHYLKLAMEQAQRMQRLVDDLLTLSALETDSPPPSEEPVDVVGLLEEVRRDAEALSAGRHRIEVESEEDGGAGTVLLGSAKELRSACVNLASNAVRYTPAGGRITLRWKRTADGGEFSVEDNGIGIEAEHIPRLTERFYRVDRGRSRETGGTGLGLAIVKHVLTRHQATLQVDSEPGRGSRFTVRFPARRVSAALAAARS